MSDEIDTRAFVDNLYTTSEAINIESPTEGYFNISILQSPYFCYTEYDRYDLFDICSALGGLLAVVAYLVEYLIQGYQEFTMDKSMMKRLYSVEK